MKSTVLAWQKRILALRLPQVSPVVRIPQVKLSRGWVVAVFISAAAVYCFGIGRARYQATSDFLVRQPLPPAMATPNVVGALLGGPAMLGSLEDGRYLAVYLHSPEVMQRVFLQLLREGRYKRQPPDLLAGIENTANADHRLVFFRRQVQVWPQELSGVIQLTTTGLDPVTALRLNNLLLLEAKAFVNQMNQAISRDQLGFAQQEVERARQRLNQSTDKLNRYRSRYGQLDPVLESTATSGYITALEAKLVELKVEEASQRRQFRDPKAPEVQLVADQVLELQKQINTERTNLATPQGRDLGGRASQALKLQNDVAFATESLRAAMTAVENSRMESQRQLKFVVMLSEPRKPYVQAWDWRWKALLGSAGILITGLGTGSFLQGVKERK
jgi:capsular polysaccharide transport system permease protein